MTERYPYGNLTLDNIEAFVERLRALLAGKRYTFISVNECRNWVPEIRVNQQIRGREPVGGPRSPDGDASNIHLYEEKTYTANDGNHGRTTASHVKSAVKLAMTAEVTMGKDFNERLEEPHYVQ